MYFFDLAEKQARTLVQGVFMKAVYGEKIMLAEVELEPGAVVPRHQHIHEQMGYVSAGELEFQIGDETKICRAGESYLIPSHVFHEVHVAPASPAKVLDVFSPPREEYK